MTLLLRFVIRHRMMKFWNEYDIILTGSDVDVDEGGILNIK